MNKKSRRNLLKGFAVSLPAAWAAPVVESVILPAHAKASVCQTVFDLSDAFPARGDGGGFVNCEGRQRYRNLVITNCLPQPANLVVTDGGNVDDWLEIDGQKLSGWSCGINNYPTGTVLKLNIPPGGTVTVEHWDFAGPGTSANITIELKPTG